MGYGDVARPGKNRYHHPGAEPRPDSTHSARENNAKPEPFPPGTGGRRFPRGWAGTGSFPQYIV
jgi:hypothetical protein